MSDLHFFDELERELERVAHQRARRHPPRRTLRVGVVAVVIVAITAVVLSLSGNGNPGPSLLARAYAATSSTGQILFYRTTTYAPGEDRPDQYATRDRSTSSVWTSQHTVRTVEHQVLGGAPGNPSFRISSETVISGTHLTDWESTPTDPAGTITATTLPKRTCNMQDTLVSLQCGTPLEAVRKLYRSGALHLVFKTLLRGHRVDVLSERTPGPPMSGSDRASTLLTRVFVDASTFDPILVQVSSRDYRSTTTFADFTRIALSNHQRLLRMSPHPGAPVQRLPTGGTLIRTRPATPPTHKTAEKAKVLRDIQLGDVIHTRPFLHAKGAVELVADHGVEGLAIVTRGLVPTTPNDAYGIWLLNASSNAHNFLGYISGQPKDGHTEDEVALPRSALERYDVVELTLEGGHRAPSQPGRVVLDGKLR